MHSAPFNHSDVTTGYLGSIGDEVQAELDHHRASRQSANTSLTTPQISSENVPSESGAIIGLLAGPFIYALFVLVCQRIFAPELMADDEYGLMLMGTLPYGLILGGYIGARLPQLLAEGRWKCTAVWLALMGGVAAVGLLSSISEVAHLYMPFYALPVVSLLWIEVMNRCKETVRLIEINEHRYHRHVPGSKVRLFQENYDSST